MESVAADLAQRLAERAEAVCHHYLPNGVRRGSYWIVGDVSGAKGRSLYVRLRSSSNTAAGKFVDYVALLVMLRRCDWALSYRRSTAFTQHNVSVPREVS
jgi:hypothetical protein